MNVMENKSGITNFGEATSQQEKPLYIEYSENNSHMESVINATFPTDCLSLENSKETEMDSNLQVEQFDTQSIANKEPKNLKGILMKKSKNTTFKIPSRSKISSGCAEKIVSSSRPLSTPSINDNVVESILSSTMDGSRSKILVDSQIKSLKEEITTLIKQCIDKEETILSLTKRLAASEQSRSENQKKCSNLEHANEKLRKSLSDTTEKCDAVQQELNAANSQIENANRSKKAMATAKLDLEKKLALFSVQRDKLKAEFQDLAKSNSDLQMVHQKEIEDRKAEAKNSTKQKKELVEVVIKQMQLVNNLKRQVLHFKAGIAQKFTENEVVKAAEDSF